MRRLVAIIGLLVSASCVFTTQALAQSALPPDAVKAAFLLRFASFVQWPPSAFGDDQSPIRLCIVGDGAVAPLRERTAPAQGLNGRAFEVRNLSGLAAARDCHIVYVTGAVVDDTLRAVRGHPVLTVTDAASGRARGMIHFVIVQDHVRFHIDDAQAAESGLFISSRLLALAVSVRRRAQ